MVSKKTTLLIGMGQTFSRRTTSSTLGGSGNPFGFGEKGART